MYANKQKAWGYTVGETYLVSRLCEFSFLLEFIPNRSLGCDESPDGATELQAGGGA